jgi:hypothetical protein
VPYSHWEIQENPVEHDYTVFPPIVAITARPVLEYYAACISHAAPGVNTDEQALRVIDFSRVIEESMISASISIRTFALSVKFLLDDFTGNKNLTTLIIGYMVDYTRVALTENWITCQHHTMNRSEPRYLTYSDFEVQPPARKETKFEVGIPHMLKASSSSDKKDNEILPNTQSEVKKEAAQSELASLVNEGKRASTKQSDSESDKTDSDAADSIGYDTDELEVPDSKVTLCSDCLCRHEEDEVCNPEALYSAKAIKEFEQT